MSEWVSEWAEFRTSVASRLARLFDAACVTGLHWPAQIQFCLRIDLITKYSVITSTPFDSWMFISWWLKAPPTNLFLLSYLFILLALLLLTLLWFVLDIRLFRVFQSMMEKGPTLLLLLSCSFLTLLAFLLSTSDNFARRPLPSILSWKHLAVLKTATSTSTNTNTTTTSGSTSLNIWFSNRYPELDEPCNDVSFRFSKEEVASMSVLGRILFTEEVNFFGSSLSIFCSPTDTSSCCK